MRLGDLTLDQVAEICTRRGAICVACPLDNTGVCETTLDGWDLDAEVDMDDI